MENVVLLVDQQLSDSQEEERMEVQHAPTQHLSPTQLLHPDLYVDIPHTYVNVFDGSQVRGKILLVSKSQIVFTLKLTNDSGVAQWVARLTRNVEVVGSSPIKGPRCFLEQETLPLLLSTGWFQERIRA